jgi:hypothetical protein
MNLRHLREGWQAAPRRLRARVALSVVGMFVVAVAAGMLAVGYLRGAGRLDAAFLGPVAILLAVSFSCALAEHLLRWSP